MPYFIRPVVAHDEIAWRVLWDGYVAFYRAAVTEEITASTWSRLIADDGPFHGLLAVDENDTAVGLVHYLFHPVTWSVGPRCYLEDLFVDEAARGTGAGRALIEAVYADADRVGADQVYWLTEQSNETARKLYDRVGRLTNFIKYQR